MAEPRACPTACGAPGCSPRSAPTSSGSPPARPARARRNCCGSANEDLVAVAAPKVAAQLLARVAALAERQLNEELEAARCWACCRHGDLYPAALRDAADAPWALIGRGDPGLLDGLEPFGAVTIVGARRATSYGREVARELGRELAAAGIVVVSGLAFGIDACAHRGALDAGRTIAVLGCGADIAYPAAPPLALAADQRAGPGHLRVAARAPPLALDLPGPQPDHGGAGRDDGRRRGGGALRLADHRRPGGRPRPRPRRRARPGQLASLGRLPTTCSPEAPASSATPRTSSTRCSAPGAKRIERAGAALDPGCAAVLAAVEMGEDNCDGVAAALGLSGPDAAAALARLELLGYVTCSTMGAYSRTLLPATRRVPASRLPA